MKISSNWQKLRAKQEKSVSNTKNKIPTSSSVRKNRKQTGVPIRTPLTKTLQVQKLRELQLKEPLKTTIANSNLHDTKIGKIIAMDCEFVGVGENGIQSELARVSIVNFYGNVIFDAFVKPQSRVTDWRTWVSGVTPGDMFNAIPFKTAQEKVADLLKDGRILVGHAIKNDLEALFLTHPRSQIRDTSKHTPYRVKYAAGKTPSLKKLSAHVLKKSIQDGEHSSIEDAKITMELYKFDRKKFEELNNKKCSPK